MSQFNQSYVSFKHAALTVVLLFPLTSFANVNEVINPVEPVLSVGQQRLQANQQHQQAVDTLAEKSFDINKQYWDELRIVDGLTMYNQMLDKQLADQQTEIQKAHCYWA